MHDSKVRHSHHEAQGQRVKPGQFFHIGTSKMRHPGDTSAPMKEWVNCRCTVAPVPVHDNQAAAGNTGPHEKQGAVTMAEHDRDPDEEVGEATAMPWHGVLAPEGVWSGDKRKFAPGALTSRDLPLPLTYQKTSDDGHKGSVTVASIDYINRDENGLMKAGGTFLQTPEADEVVGLLAHFGQATACPSTPTTQKFELEGDVGRRPRPGVHQGPDLLGQHPWSASPRSRRPTSPSAPTPR